MVLNRVGADLQVFISGFNNRGAADIKDIMATGKRSQVARLVCEPSLVINTLIGYNWLENLRKRFSSRNVFLVLGSKSFTCGRALAKISSCCRVYEISWRGSGLPKQRFILAPCHLRRFERRNLWDSSTEIPY